jgi:hypothetical protein
MGRYGNEPPSVYPELVEQFVTGFNEGYDSTTIGQRIVDGFDVQIGPKDH